MKKYVYIYIWISIILELYVGSLKSFISIFYMGCRHETQYSIAKQIILLKVGKGFV